MNFTDYYQEYKDYFWGWEDEAEVLSISGGSTVAYREQVTEILINIAEQGLPPFGSFLLAIIATNKTIDNSLELIEKKVTQGQTKGRVHFLEKEFLTDALLFLKILQEIPQDYKIGKRRSLLLQTIFNNCHNRLNPATSKGIAEGLRNNISGKKRLVRTKEITQTVFLKDFRTISLLIRKFPTAQSVIDAMGELPEIDESELPLLEESRASDTTYKDFVEELMADPNAFQAAALIKPIWAGFHIPIFNAHPSQQPLGGVSDLSNKGDFDKLLVSEFANDDLVFMNRIANNEALYMHREMPPVKDNLHRTILIDVSLKNWGTPKILAYACYIAIARHPKALTESRAFIVGNKCVSVACATAGDIIDGLQLVDAGLHAGQGLALFLEENKNDKQLEIFYITTTASLKYPEVQQQLAAHQTLLKYIITTDADGEINFYRRKNNTQKHLQTIRLPLEKLWAKKTVKEEKEIEKEISAVFIPLLLPTPNVVRKVLPLQDEVYCIADNCLLRRNLQYHNKGAKGWELVLRKIYGNGHYEIGRLGNGQVLFLAYNLQDKMLSITNINTLQTAKTIFKAWKSKFFRDFLFNQYQKFMYLALNPDAYEFIPDFNTGEIKIINLHAINSVFAVTYPERQKAIHEFSRIYANHNIFTRVNEVYINHDNQLVFNIHKLYVTNSGQLYFDSNGVNTAKIKVAIRKHNKRTFEFNDGSTVTVDECGYITLASSNPAIPEVFFASQLEVPLGMATQSEFAGKEFFYNEELSKVKVTLTKVGGLKIEAIKIIKKYTAMGLADAKYIVDSAPKQICKSIDVDDAKKMQQELAQIDCTTTIENSPHPKQNIISPQTFYHQNIATFIGHIINHGAKD